MKLPEAGCCVWGIHLMNLQGKASSLVQKKNTRLAPIYWIVEDAHMVLLYEQRF